jgi:hypothetical protein
MISNSMNNFKWKSKINTCLIHLTYAKFAFIINSNPKIIKMKKLLFTIALTSVLSFANAQTLTTKEGNAILPESGDWSFSIDAAPLGTLFQDGSSGSAFQNQYLQNMTIIGKYMTSANSAIRGKLRLGFGSNSEDAFSTATGSTSTPPATVTDTRDEGYTAITLGAGIQNYKGKGRIQGYYGAEAFIMLGSSSTEYSYGNAITSTAPAPERTDFDGLNGGTTSGNYVTEDNSGSTFGFGVRGFVGAEYFFAAKMSFGVEYGWGLGLSSTGEGEMTSESWNGSAVTSTTTQSGGSSNFGLDVDNASGAVFFSFYF